MSPRPRSPATRRAHRQHPRELPAASLLRLIWLASPALPVGGFSYSEGLESAIENTGLASEAAVADWLLDQLHLTQARSDMAVLAKALGAWRGGGVGWGGGGGGGGGGGRGGGGRGGGLGAAPPGDQRTAPANRANGPLP